MNFKKLFLIKLFLLIFITSVLTSCGFKLRTKNTYSFNNFHVDAKGFSFFSINLRNTLIRDENVEITDKEKAQVIIRIRNEIKKKEILSLSSSGNVKEYELIYIIEYEIIDNRSKKSDFSNLKITRYLTYDDTKVLAKESEEKLLFEEMILDAVNQMRNRLSTL